MILEKTSASWVLGAVGSGTTVWGWSRAEFGVVATGITILGGAGLWFWGSLQRQRIAIGRERFGADEDERDRITRPLNTEISKLQGELRTALERAVKAESLITEWQRQNTSTAQTSGSSPATPKSGD